MAFLGIVPPDQAPEGIAQTYGRIQDLLGTEELPEVFLAMGHVEPFLKDFYMNFKKFVYSDGALDARSKAGIALAVAIHGRCAPWQEFYAQRCRDLGWEQHQLAEITALVATNYMYNTFFKFRDISGSDLFGGMGVGLRAHTFANVSLDPKMVQLINIAISDINACKPCTSGHVAEAREQGLSDEQILEAVQCASTAFAGVLFANTAI